MAFALLLATPVAVALSRNATFPVLVVAVCLLMASVGLQDDGVEKLKSVFLRVFQFKLVAPATLIAMVAILLGLASLVWSTSPARGLGAIGGMLVAAFASAYGCVLVIRHITVPSWPVWALSIAMAVACLLIISELTFSSPIRGAFGASTEPFRLNRAAVCVALMAPLLFLFKGSHKRFFAVLTVVVLVWFAAFLSISESAKLAIIIITGTLLLANFSNSKWLIVLVGAGVLATHILAPFAVYFLFAAIGRELIEAVSMALAQSPTHYIRVEIWWAYVQQILEAPLFGHGLQSSYSALDAYSGSDETVLRGLGFIHPHNFSIQVWYELGLTGVLLSSAIIFLFLRYIFILPSEQGKVAVSIFCGIWTVAYVSHGAWQHWWWAFVGILLLLFSILGKIRNGNIVGRC